MSWLPALNAAQWALLAAVPIGILLLYFLKLRREPVEVPSTYLWSRTIEDLHVNSLLQRLRRSLLLLLQLLAIGLAVLALLRPGIRGETSGEGRTVFLFDVSASMQATDVEGDANRFELARRLIGERIEAMNDTDSAMLITFADRPETVQSFTSDRRRLRDALGRIEVTNRPTNILGALKAADGLANPRRSSEIGDLNDVQVADAMPATLTIFSDGRFDRVSEFNLGNLVPEYVPIGSGEVNNVAIAAFSAERNVEKPSEVQALAIIVNVGNEPIETTATLSLDGDFLDAALVALEPSDQTGLSFTLDSEEAATLRLALDIEDDLAVDNIAYAGLTPMRNVAVLVVTEANTPLEMGLSTSKASRICNVQFVPPSYLETDEYRARSEAGIDDLVIYDRCAPLEMPSTNTFFIHALPPSQSPAAESESSNGSSRESEAGGANEQGWSWSSEPSQVVLVDIDRTHPLMRYLELFSLLIFSGQGIDGPPGSVELLGSDVGSMLVVASRDGYQDLVLGFEIITSDADGELQTNTNWHVERSWPVFLLNVLRYLAGAAEAAGASSYRPGETVRLRLENALAAVDVQRIGGQRYSVSTGPSGVTEIIETNEPGNYRVEAGEQLTDLFAINLFDRTESEISVAAEVNLGYESVEGSTGSLEQRKEYWRWALVAMLGLLATEWWVYTRRVA